MFVNIRFESIRFFMTLYLYYVSPSDFKTRGCRTGQDVTLGPERALGFTRRRKKGGREGGGGGGRDSGRKRVRDPGEAHAQVCKQGHPRKSQTRFESYRLGHVASMRL